MKKLMLVLLGIMFLSLGAFSQIKKVSTRSSRTFDHRERGIMNQVVGAVNDYLVYPYGTINMADYYRSQVNVAAWKYRGGTINMIPRETGFNMIELVMDTLSISGNGSSFSWKYD